MMVRYLIHFPSYGVTNRVHYQRSANYWVNTSAPYSCYWNVEGGNLVGKRNNLGLPGIDVDTSRPYTVMVAGSSYIEAFQVPPENMAVSVFDMLLQKQEAGFAVLNVGNSGHDPYDSWFRINYLASLGLMPDYVILIIEADYDEWFARHPHPLLFAPDDHFGEKDTSAVFLMQRKLRNRVSFINLIARGMKGASNDNDSESEASTRPKEKTLSNDMEETLLAYRDQFPHFMLVSILNDDQYNLEVNEFCQANGILFFRSGIARSENKLNGKGHLSELGNRELGEFLYDSFIEARHYWDNVDENR